MNCSGMRKDGKGRAAEDVPEQGTRHKQAGQDGLEGDRKIWKEIQPSADVPTLATVLLISSGVCRHVLEN